MAVASQRVAKLRAIEILDPAERITLSLSAGIHVGREIHHHGTQRAEIRRRVRAPAAGHRIRPGTANEKIVAQKSVQHIVAVVAVEEIILFIAGDTVVVIGTDHTLDVAGNYVTISIAAVIHIGV